MFSIRQASAGDIQHLIELDTIAPFEPARAQHIRDWIEAGECYVAEQNGEAIAYAVLSYNFYHSGMIEMLMVGEPVRRRGCGEALIRHLIGICRTDKLWTSTNLTNQPIQALLARMGFTLSGFITGLDENDPELVFCITIP